MRPPQARRKILWYRGMRYARPARAKGPLPVLQDRDVLNAAVPDRYPHRRKITVKIPAGIENGMRLRVAGEGEVGMRGGQRGDLYVLIYVRPHEIFERHGSDILCEVPISM